ncbi:unnamed protein product [Rotaria sp. Silwood1]|nr:unnamed protein product [Rotaria sp. Silwood1]
MGDMNGPIVAGGNAPGNRLEQLNGPTDVLIDKMTNCLIISDSKNRRIIQRSRSRGTMQDDQRYFYISDVKKHEVRKYQLKENMQNGTVGDGGNEEGSHLNHFDFPTYIFVDCSKNIYVSDWNTHHVMKWINGTKKGVIIVGGQDEGNTLKQFSNPSGLFVDESDVLYVTVLGNNRIMCWTLESKQGMVIAGETPYVIDSAHGYILYFSKE